ncbi:MAG TPA: peptidoglycan recognition family protein [candidate division Zixibacteria bacterium]|nr:peptidoglycan recognition family protein [candidate division Zixibacteria bacterium]
MSDVFPGAVLRQLVEWGFPQQQLRPTPDPDLAFSVIHITGNPRLPSADAEISWRLNDPANQNSATFFVNRDGSIRQALGDPLHMDPWANGAIRGADTSNPRIAAVLRDRVNPNTRTLLAIENVGYEPGYSITAAQEDADARIIAYYHAKAELPITRETVIGHYQIDGLERPNCPAVDKRVVDRIVARAAAIAVPELPPEEEDVIDPALIIPPFLVTLKPGGTAYGTANRTDVKADNWPQIVTPNVPCYGLPVGWSEQADGTFSGPRQADGKVPLAAIRVKTARGPEIWFYGPDLMLSQARSSVGTTLQSKLSRGLTAAQSTLQAVSAAKSAAEAAVEALS